MTFCKRKSEVCGKGHDTNCWRLQPITTTIRVRCGLARRFISACSDGTDARRAENIFSKMRQTAVLKEHDQQHEQPSNRRPQLSRSRSLLRDWSVLDTLQVGDSLTFHADLYSSLHNALLYRRQRDKRKYTQRQRGDVTIVLRL